MTIPLLRLQPAALEAAMELQHHERFKTILAELQRIYGVLQDSLVSAPPEFVQLQQGKAQLLKDLLRDLTNPSEAIKKVRG